VPIKIFCNKCGYKFYEDMPRWGYIFGKQVDFKIKPRR